MGENRKELFPSESQSPAFQRGGWISTTERDYENPHVIAEKTKIPKG